MTLDFSADERAAAEALLGLESPHAACRDYFGASRMKTWGGIRSAGTQVARRHLLPLLGIGLVVFGVGCARWISAALPLEALDPTFMKAVTASVSPNDVKAILAYRRASGPVHIRLYTSCDPEQRCIILTTMDFTDERSESSTISLKVAVHVMPDTGGAHRTTRASWQIRSFDPSNDGSATYAGDFSTLKDVPFVGDRNAMAGLLISIRSAIGTALRAHGVIAKP